MKAGLAEDHNKEQSESAFSAEDLLNEVLRSDLAIEVEAEFTGRTKMGFDVPAATANVFSKFRPALGDPHDGPVVLIALAALQVREGHLQNIIRSSAIDLIDSGEALAAYRSADFSQRKAASLMLEQFALLLMQQTTRDDD